MLLIMQIEMTVRHNITNIYTLHSNVEMMRTLQRRMLPCLSAPEPPLTESLCAALSAAPFREEKLV